VRSPHAPIVTVTPNGSVDLVLRSVGPPTEEEQPVVQLGETAGGKGNNVARFLTAAGHEVTALGFAGGSLGERLDVLLREAGVTPDLTQIDGTTRSYTTVIEEAGGRVSYRMAGPRITEGDSQRLGATVVAAAAHAGLVILAGSLPPGGSADLYAAIIDAVRETPVVLDSSGEALAAGIMAAPWMVKVNRDELLALDARAPDASAPVTAWSDVLGALAARTTVRRWWVTLGAAGSVGWVDGEVVRVLGAQVRVVNTTGAGDAFLAGLLDAALRGASNQLAARTATAWAAAVCEQEVPIPPMAGRIAALIEQLAGAPAE